MPLQGTFDVLDFSEVLHLLARHQMTGRLFVRHRSFGANIFLESGQLTGADQSEHQSAAAIGDVRGRIEEICFEMLEAERGSFEFQPGKASTLPVTTRHRVDTVLTQAKKRLDTWRELQELIPSMELQPRLVGDLTRAEVTIDKERWRMLTSVDGRRNLRAIGRILNISDYDVCRVLAGLINDGVVELDGLSSLSAANRDAMPTVPSPDPVERRAGADDDRYTSSIRATPSAAHAARSTVAAANGAAPKPVTTRRGERPATTTPAKAVRKVAGERHAEARSPKDVEVLTTATEGDGTEIVATGTGAGDNGSAGRGTGTAGTGTVATGTGTGAGDNGSAGGGTGTGGTGTGGTEAGAGDNGAAGTTAADDGPGPRQGRLGRIRARPRRSGPG